MGAIRSFSNSISKFNMDICRFEQAHDGFHWDQIIPINFGGLFVLINHGYKQLYRISGENESG